MSKLSTLIVDGKEWVPLPNASLAPEPEMSQTLGQEDSQECQAPVQDSQECQDPVRDSQECQHFCVPDSEECHTDYMTTKRFKMNPVPEYVTIGDHSHSVLDLFPRNRVINPSQKDLEKMQRGTVPLKRKAEAAEASKDCAGSSNPPTEEQLLKMIE